MNKPDRQAFSLLEVLLAASILLGCVIVLGHLAAIGSHRARIAEELSTAQILCQSVMDQLLAGAMPLEPAQKVPLADRPDWLLSVELEPTTHPGLTALRVTVAQDVPEDQRARAFSLVRWLRTPKLTEAADTEQTPPPTGPDGPAPTSPELLEGLP